MWFYLPRKMSRERYDEVRDRHKCVNVMLATPDGVLEPDGSQVLMQPYLTFRPMRGCSDFFFVPGSDDPG